MKFSLNWLKDYVALDASAEEIARAVTFLGFEVEQVSQVGAPPLDRVVVGEVLAREPHPNADRLSVCRVDVGPAGGIKTIVCGAQNYRVGDRVPVALPGAVLPGDFAIRQSKIRGQLSDGMMCSAREIGLGEDAAGLLILADRPAVGLPIGQALPPPDTVFDVEITPNRPDCLSYLGMARELAAWYERPLKYPEIGYPKLDAAEPSAPLSSVEVLCPRDCPLYTAQAVADVRIAPSPPWLQQRLRASGLRPVNNAVDVGNYVMLEYGQPLHAFDARRLEGGRIVVRPAAEGERIATLDGREHALGPGMAVIADAARPVAVAGIMGGRDSAVQEGTTAIVLECAVFRRQEIRRTSRRLGLASDSSYRYERGVDPHTAGEAGRRALDLLLRLTAGRAVGPAFRVGGDVPWKREIALAPAYVRERLGFDLPDAEIRSSLEGLELKVGHEEADPQGGPIWTVTIPSWRYDLDRPIDLVEEVLRLHGTDEIPAARVAAPGLMAEDAPTVRFHRRAAEYLTGHDFHECVTTTLRSAAEASAWNFEAGSREMAVENPFAEDQSHLRPSVLPGLLEVLKFNRSRGVAASRLYEVGRVFLEAGGSGYECAGAGFLLAEDPRRRWLRRAPPDFYAAKRHVEALAAAAGVELAAEPLVPLDGRGGWQEGHSAGAGEIGRGWIARFGLLKLEAIRALGLEGKVFGGIFAILPERLPPADARPRYAAFSPYPPALRDLALTAAAAVPAAEAQADVVRAARAAVGAAFALESAEIFDLYRGAGLPPDRKSLAFSLVFRAADRTLTDEEVNAALQRIQGDLAGTGRYEIRK